MTDDGNPCLTRSQLDLNQCWKWKPWFFQPWNSNIFSISMWQSQPNLPIFPSSFSRKSLNPEACSAAWPFLASQRGRPLSGWIVRSRMGFSNGMIKKCHRDKRKISSKTHEKSSWAVSTTSVTVVDRNPQNKAKPLCFVLSSGGSDTAIHAAWLELTEWIP